MIHLLDLKQPEQATGYLQRVVEINPQNQIVLSELVSLYEEQGKLNEGLNFMTDVFAKNPESPDLSYGIGQLLSLQGRDSDAIGYFQKATESDANSIRAYRDLGEAYSRSGDPVKAIESYDKAIEHEQREVDDKAARGLPTQFAEERMNYTKMAKASELIRMGDLDRAQQLIDEVSRTMAGDEAVISLQDTLNKKRAG
jgi:tetratricopeptide (TPR) repeat protein